MSETQFDVLEAVRKVAETIGGFEAEDQERILRWAREIVGLTVPSQPASQAAAIEMPATSEAATAPPAPGGTDIKSFLKQKSPASDNQFAATVAYYYRFEAPEQLRKESVSGDDLQEACRKVGRDRLTSPGQTLINAHNQGLLDKGEQRGSYVINTVGENLVAMVLPGDATRVTTKRPKRRSGKRAAPAKAKAKRAKR